MQTRRWLNPSLTQTLQFAVILLYLVGAFALLFGIGDYGTAYFFIRIAHLGSVSGLLRVLVAAINVAAGYGIANERKWAYYLGIAAAAAPLIGDIGLGIQYHVSPLNDPINLLFQVGLFALLVHPQSRDYQRVWFK
jgi:hypothetical protein